MLKTSGTAIAGLGAYSGLSTASVQTDSLDFDPDGQVKPDKPVFSTDKKRGFAFGSFGNSVSPNTINEVQKRVLHSQSKDQKKGGVLTINPTAEPPEKVKKTMGQNEILGFGVKWTDGGLKMKTKRQPRVMSRSNAQPELAPETKQLEMERAHADLLDFVNGNGGLE